ncbi:hypothetical protein B2J93_42 [Marssonina coronariae]|uniref:Myb-like domain-containing protein n=1 Tax=Diplocarpon coronariae TaxID=2795749 RepID=A0A218Z5H2_9HELO|nr:hypothetical protein B2J93_42 [Marssonina coronariae]
MPKAYRAIRNQGCYRVSPAWTPSPYASISDRVAGPHPYYSSTSGPLAMSQPGYSQGYVPHGGPVQQSLAPQYTSMPPAQSQPHPQPPPPPPSLRSSSGAWAPSDDQTLLAARAQGLNWAPIQSAYFPTKTANACRKRHERLMERRSADDWDGLKLESLAQRYMAMRREIWAGLAAQTGEKWNVVEQKCMSQGLKNLQTAARSCARRERMLPLSPHDPSIPFPLSTPTSTTHPHPSTSSLAPNANFTDDSGYADEAEAEAEPEPEPEPGYESDRSGSYHYHSHSASNGSNASRSLSLSGSGSGGAGMSAMGMGMGMGGGGGGGGYMGVNAGVGVDARFLSQQQQQQQAAGRLPSMDMGIGAIINRGPQPSSGVR